MTNSTSHTVLTQPSDRELVVTRTFAAPAPALFAAWSKAELFRQWWVPKSSGAILVSCEMDVRVGGHYRLEFGHSATDQTMAFFGRYLDVVENERIVWTNEESPDGAVTTVTFAAADNHTIVSVSNLFANAEALEAEIASGATSAMDETLGQLDAFVATAPNS